MKRNGARADFPASRWFRTPATAICITRQAFARDIDLIKTFPESRVSFSINTRD